VTAAFDPLEEDDAALLLERLVDKSLVALAQEVDGRRYRLLTTLRSFAMSRLVEAGEEMNVQEAHAAYFADWSESAYEHTVGPDQAVWLERMGHEQANAIAGLGWALEENRIELATRLAASYGWYWLLRGPLTVGRHLVEEVIAAGGDETGSNGRQLLMCAGYLCGELGDLAAARRYLEAKLEADETANDTGAMASTHTNLGVVADREFDHHAARRYFERSVELLSGESATEVTWERLAGAHQGIAATLRQLGEGDQARNNAERAVDFAKKCGHRYLECHSILTLTQLDIDSGRLDAAAQALEAADPIAASLGDDTARYQTAIQRSRLHSAHGRLEDAQQSAELAWEIVVESGDRSRLPEVADQVTLIAIATGDLETAERYGRIAVGEEVGAARVPGLQLLACAAAASGRVREAAGLLTRAAALQQQRGCVTSANLVTIVAKAEATCRAKLGADYTKITQPESA
jgi:tetratricopeptide (TPR) repeat protein